jgi:hypothetical protein
MMREGCDMMERPCDVEKAWLTASPEWCPAGRHAELAEQSDEFGRVADAVAPTSWRCDVVAEMPLALVTVAVGRQAKEIASYTVPMMQRYAIRCNAQLVMIDDDQFPTFRIGNKFRLAEIGKLFERTLFVDMDAWITEETPNLFKLSGKRVWMHRDADQLTVFDWLHHDAEMLAKTQLVSKPEYLACYNTGLVLFNREHADIWQAPPRPFVGTHTAEQTWVEMQAQRLGVPIGRLPLRYNLQWWMRDQWGKSPAFIHHLANAPHDERLQWLRQQAPSVSSQASACR